jgi:hypothetical protein
MKPPSEDIRQPLSDRIATGVVSGVAAALTLLAYPLILAGVGSDIQPVALYAHVFSKVGLVVIIVASVIGFLIGSERMAGVFSFFWGTHSVWEDDWARRLGTVLMIVAIVAVAIYASS